MSSIVSNHRHLKSSVFLLFHVLLLCLPHAVSAQIRDGDASSVPLELTPADPEISDLLRGEFDSCKTLDPDGRAQRLQKAFELAERRGLVGDKAVIETLIASTFVLQGDLNHGFTLLRQGLQDAIDARREVLQADILISLGAEAQMKGDTQEAVNLVTRSLSLSGRNGNLYGRARGLGELTRLRLLLGKYDDAKSSLDEALNIDRLNGYKFEALHLVYRADYLGLVGQEEQAIETMANARAKALISKDPYTFILAENGYAFGLARTGKAQEASRQMDSLRAGELAEFVQNENEKDCLHASLELPIFRILFLEGFANVLRISGQKEKENQIWQELFTVSQTLGLEAGEAEAKEKAANVESQLKRTDVAIKDYAVAADLYRKIGNDALLDQVEISEALLLVNSGKGKDAVPLVEEIAAYAKQHKNRQLEFKAYITLAGIYQSSDETNKARSVLENATSIVHPGPFDDEIDDQTVHLAYVTLSDIYRKVVVPPRELVSIDQAFFISVHLKDDTAQRREVAYLDQRLNELGIRELVTERQKEGQLTEALTYSYVLYLRDGSSDKPAENPNWQRMLSLPFEIVQKHGGAQDLADLLKEFGPMLGIQKLPLLDALAQYYVEAGPDALLAEKYATEAEDFLTSLKGDQDVLRVRSTCILARTYSSQGKNAEARTKSTECLNFAEKAGDQREIAFAQAIDVMVQAQTGNLAAAKTSLEKLIAKSPSNAELFVELAISLASAKLYREANTQLESAVKKLAAAKDKKAEASAYVRTALTLGSDSSEIAKKFRLEYLDAARKLYRELGAQAEEAGTLIALGDYFLGLAQNETAIENYRQAQTLALGSGERNVVAQALLGLGNAHQAEKNYLAAQDFHRKAAHAFRELNNSVGETISLRNLGRDSYALGDPDEALTALLDARKTARTSGEFNEYLADYFLGDFYRSQGEYEKALASFHAALEITSKAKDIEHSAYSRLAIASLDGFIGSWEDAIVEAEAALSLFTQIGNKEGQANGWAELTTIYSDRTSAVKNFDKAQDCYKKALDLGYSRTLDLDLMEIYLQTGKYSEAARIAADNARICSKERNDACKAHALISLSEAERLNGRLRASRLALGEAKPLVSKSADFYLRGRLVYQESRLLASEGKLNDALTSYKQLISIVETIKGRLATQEQKSLAENYGFIYDELVALLYSMSKKASKGQDEFATESLKYAEKNKARQFAESWGRAFKNQMRLAVAPTLREREQALTSERERLASRVEAASDNQEANQKETKASLEAELATVQNRIRSFLEELRKASPQYAAIAYPEEIQIASLPLRRGETLVEFKMTDDSTFVWVVQNRDGTKNDLSAFYQIPKKRIWFLERLALIRKALNSGHPEAVDWTRSEELFGALFPPAVEKIIMESAEVIFIPDDLLFVLPFELFSPEASKGEFPFLRKPTTYYPSAVSLQLARAGSRSSDWSSAFLGIADPITSPQDERFELAQALKTPGSSTSASKLEARTLTPDPEKLKSRGFVFDRLPGTAVEVQSIATLLKGRRELVETRFGISATKDELLNTDLSRFRFLHFATHGVLPVDTAIQEPSLVLSYDGTKLENMFLPMSEILTLKLQSESVVLSACNTGSGAISRAEGVMSLGRAFLAAGAASVTVSLWQVSDESTASLMTSYYKGILETKRKNVALAEARYAVFSSGLKNPFFWAPFVLIGE